MRPLLLLSFTALAAQAQTIPGAVLTKDEPHHHLAYEDDVLRVLRVSVAPHDSTWLHEHDRDYVWIALGTSTIINAKLGKPDVKQTLADLGMHYTPAKFAHVARNTGSTPFDNITVELLKPQKNARNLCEPAIENKPTSCRPPVTLEGVTVRPEVTTNQLRVELVTLEPGKGIPLEVTTKPTWVIALDTADVTRGLVIPGPGTWTGGAMRISEPGKRVLRNTSARRVRALIIIGQ